MAEYKVPQDVEADDKLIGPFSFRQFIYLIIAAILIGISIVLFNIFPFLVIIPIPFILFLLVLALPIKKDQPMETYLSAIVDFYLKPQKRIWMPAQPDTTITIASPKKVEENRTKNLSQEEAAHRLSFLANIVDTEGYAIKDTNSNLRDDVASEAAAAQDIFESNNYQNINQDLQQNDAARHNQLVEQMRNAINANNTIDAHNTTISHQTVVQQPTPTPIQQPMPPAQPIVSTQMSTAQTTPVVQSPMQTTTPQFITTTPYAPPTLSTQAPLQQATPAPAMQPAQTETDVNNAVAASSATIQPDMDEIHDALAKEDEFAAPVITKTEPVSEFLPQDIPSSESVSPQTEPEPEPQPAPQQPTVPTEELQNLANNSDYSIETLAKQAKRLEEKQSNNQEVYISLH